MIYLVENFDEYKNINAEKGDTILLKRGMFVRGKLSTVDGVSYGAYGEGVNPTFCGSVDIKNDLWVEIEDNIWQYKGILSTEVCSLIFNNEEFGVLRWEKDDLQKQGDFWDNCFGKGEKNENTEKHIFLLYSKDDPSRFYSSIECVLREHRQLADMGESVSISDINFINNGVHAIAGEKKARNVSIKNCKFVNIGGSVWDKEKKIRFGNAIECWNVAENVLVEGCVFDNIYDSGVTHQGGKSCLPANNFVIINNIFARCGMAAYEQRDKMPYNAIFSENVCKFTGGGLSELGEADQRRSEIWPKPVGHHIFLWRINEATENGILEISNNVFDSSICGDTVYSMIDSTAEKQIVIKNNRYKDF